MMKFCLLTGDSLEEMIQPGIIKSFFEKLPEKALHLGVRVLLAVPLPPVSVTLDSRLKDGRTP